MTKWDHAPRKSEPHQIIPGTRAPIDRDFTSLYVGGNLEDTRHFLQIEPHDADVEGTYYALLDKQAENKKVVLCRREHGDEQNKPVTCVLMPAQESSLTLAGLQFGVWEDLLEDPGEYEPRF